MRLLGLEGVTAGVNWAGPYPISFSPPASSGEGYEPRKQLKMGF